MLENSIEKITTKSAGSVAIALLAVITPIILAGTIFLSFHLSHGLLLAIFSGVLFASFSLVLLIPLTVIALLKGAKAVVTACMDNELAHKILELLSRPWELLIELVKIILNLLFMRLLKLRQLFSDWFARASSFFPKKAYLCLFCVLVLVLVAVNVNASSHPRYVVVALDLTKSFQYLDESKERIIREIIPGLGPGDVFHLLRISGNSRDDDSIVLSLTLPTLPIRPAQFENLRQELAWEKRAKRIEAQILNIKYLLCRAVKALDYFESSKTTDLWGVLVRSSYLLKTDYRARIFIAFTDLKDNVNRNEECRLNGVDVLVFYADFNKINQWKNRFSNCKAKTINILDVGKSREIAFDIEAI